MNSSQTDENNNGNLPSLLPRNLVPLAQKFLLGFGGLAAFISLFGDLSEGGGLINKWFVNNSLYINSILHLALVILVLFSGRLKVNDFHKFRKFYLSDKEKDNSVVYKIEIITRKFITYWKLLWMSWGGLYTIFFLNAFWEQEKASISEPDKQMDFIFDISLRLFNNIGTVFMILLVFALFPIIYENFSQRLKYYKDKIFPSNSFSIKSNDKLNNKDYILWLLVSYFLSSFIVSEIIFYKCEFDGNILSYFGGVIAAVAFAMMAGRFDSFYISAPQYWVILIFLYATLQPAFPSYTNAESPMLKATIAYTAFTLKGLFYFYVFKQFENWRIFYYYFGYYGRVDWIRNLYKEKYNIK